LLGEKINTHPERGKKTHLAATASGQKASCCGAIAH